MRVSEKYYDEVFDFSGQWDMPSKCGLRVKSFGEKKIVIVTELYQDNPGTSVTNAGESLFNQLCEKKGFKREEIIYIECNPSTNSKLSFYDEELFEVSFENINGESASPQYKPLTKDEVKGYIPEN